MDIESGSQEKPWFLARWCQTFIAKVMNIANGMKKLGQDDPKRIIHSLKVGLALTLVSLFYYWKPLYDGFGDSGIWAVITVVVLMEFTVGATLSKGINRGIATLVAGALGVGAENLASLFGQKGEPIILGLLVFLLGAGATFSRFVPRVKARYDYGVLIFILTFSMVSVSGYRVEEILEMAYQRLSTILLGGAICILVSIFVSPIWAGQDLHNSLSSNLDKLAIFLEGFGGEYFHCSEDEDECTVVASKDDDKSFLQGHKTVLNSKTIEESLANFARWEPRHGKFRFGHPWKQYLKIGALARQCAYQIDALNAYTHSTAQTPLQFQRMIKGSCTKMSSESGKALKALASSIKTMTTPSSADSHIQNAKTSINELKTALNSSSIDESNFLDIVPATTVASILVEIVKCVEIISVSVHELSLLASFKSIEPSVSQEKPQLLHKGSIKPVLDSEVDHVVTAVAGTNELDSTEKNERISILTKI